MRLSFILLHLVVKIYISTVLLLSKKYNTGSMKKRIFAERVVSFLRFLAIYYTPFVPMTGYENVNYSVLLARHFLINLQILPLNTECVPIDKKPGKMRSSGSQNICQ